MATRGMWSSSPWPDKESNTQVPVPPRPRGRPARRQPAPHPHSPLGSSASSAAPEKGPKKPAARHRGALPTLAEGCLRRFSIRFDPVSAGCPRTWPAGKRSRRRSRSASSSCGSTRLRRGRWSRSARWTLGGGGDGSRKSPGSGSRAPRRESAVTRAGVGSCCNARDRYAGSPGEGRLAERAPSVGRKSASPAPRSCAPARPQRLVRSGFAHRPPPFPGASDAPGLPGDSRPLGGAGPPP